MKVCPLQFTIKQEDTNEVDYKPAVSTIIPPSSSTIIREISSTETSTSLTNEIKREKSDLWLPWDNQKTETETPVCTSTEDTSDKTVVHRQESVIKVKYRVSQKKLTLRKTSYNFIIFWCFLLSNESCGNFRF